MYIVWHGHACFTFVSEAGTLVIDPYQDDYVPGLSPLRLVADQVLCSHDHKDHAARQTVTITDRPHEFQIETIPCFHDDQQGALRGTNLIHIITDNGLRVAHLGDLGCPLTQEQIDQLQNLDALLIPIGGYYTIDAAQAQAIVEQLNPRVVIPMHYRTDEFGYDVLATRDEFLRLRGNAVYYAGNRFHLTGNNRVQTAVLSYHPN